MSLSRLSSNANFHLIDTNVYSSLSSAELLRLERSSLIHRRKGSEVLWCLSHLTRVHFTEISNYNKILRLQLPTLLEKSSWRATKIHKALNFVVDCEKIAAKSNLWIRVHFEDWSGCLRNTIFFIFIKCNCRMVNYKYETDAETCLSFICSNGATSTSEKRE